ncbi:MAG: lipolytic enzyme family [Belnapia sp.]|nr:lipolytic enzyme family [Belnapia sp.]
MRRIALALLLALAAPAMLRAQEPCPAASSQPLALPATRAALAQGRKVTIIAFGSSSTEGSGASGQDRAYPAVLEAALHTALPEARLRVLNRGRGGEEIEEMMVRLETDVIAVRPTLVIWQAGANAVLRGMDPEAFSATMAYGIERVRAHGADVLLMDSQRAPRIIHAPHFERFDMALNTLSVRLQVPLFSRAALMDSWAASGLPASAVIGPDELHHNDRGYGCLARALAQSMVASLGPRHIAGR